MSDSEFGGLNEKPLTSEEQARRLRLASKIMRESTPPSWPPWVLPVMLQGLERLQLAIRDTDVAVEALIKERDVYLARAERAEADASDLQGKWLEESYARTEAEKQSARARTVLEAYEKWEAELLLNDLSWVDGLPRFTQALWDAFMVLQGERNAVLGRFPVSTGDRSGSTQALIDAVESGFPATLRDPNGAADQLGITFRLAQIRRNPALATELETFLIAQQDKLLRYVDAAKAEAKRLGRIAGQPLWAFIRVLGAKVHQTQQTVDRVLSANAEMGDAVEKAEARANGLAKVGTEVRKECDRLHAENEELKAELRWIDLDLARRAAIDDLPDRRAKISKALAVASTADKLKGELERMTAQRDRLQSMVQRHQAFTMHQYNKAIEALKLVRPLVGHADDCGTKESWSCDCNAPMDVIAQVDEALDLASLKAPPL